MAADELEMTPYLCKYLFKYKPKKFPGIFRGFVLFTACIAGTSVVFAADQKVLSAEELIGLFSTEQGYSKQKNEPGKKPLTRGVKVDGKLDRGIGGIRSGNRSTNDGQELAKNLPVEEAPPLARLGFSNILFSSGSSVLESESYAQLVELGSAIKVLMRQSSHLSFVVEGHTDSLGSKNNNLSLSLKRAEAILTFLEENFDLDSSRIKAVGFGERVPLASNDTEEGRLLNRRVEIVAKVGCCG